MAQCKRLLTRTQFEWTWQELERLVVEQEAVIRAHERKVAKHTALLEKYRAEAAVATQATAGFRTRVATEGLDRLDVNQVFELLHLLGTPVSRSILEKQEVSGVVLVALTEDDMEATFNIRTLGERRRLTGALRVSTVVCIAA